MPEKKMFCAEFRMQIDILQKRLHFIHRAIYCDKGKKHCEIYNSPKSAAERSLSQQHKAIAIMRKNCQQTYKSAYFCLRSMSLTVSPVETLAHYSRDDFQLLSQQASHSTWMHLPNLFVTHRSKTTAKQKRKRRNNDKAKLEIPSENLRKLIF